MRRFSFKILVLTAFLIISCKQNPKKEQLTKTETQKGDIVNTIINDEESFYHVDFKNYPNSDKSLPVGVFDSGTGGLTVLKAIINYDENKNDSHIAGKDGILDFDKEVFIYLGDQVNMPYGNYSKENKVDLLNEHIIKDAQFLLSNKYYSDASDTSVNTDKQPVKALVIA